MKWEVLVLSFLSRLFEVILLKKVVEVQAYVEARREEISLC
jgi:hypothetical protein